MPASFERCVEKGGRVRTVTGPSRRYGLERGQYRHVCFLGNMMFQGEVKTPEVKRER
jgi:hypothetical protein